MQLLDLARKESALAVTQSPGSSSNRGISLLCASSNNNASAIAGYHWVVEAVCNPKQDSNPGLRSLHRQCQQICWAAMAAFGYQRGSSICKTCTLKHTPKEKDAAKPCSWFKMLSSFKPPISICIHFFVSCPAFLHAIHDSYSQQVAGSLSLEWFFPVGLQNHSHRVFGKLGRSILQLDSRTVEKSYQRKMQLQSSKSLRVELNSPTERLSLDAHICFRCSHIKLGDQLQNLDQRFFGS